MLGENNLVISEDF